MPPRSMSAETVRAIRERWAQGARYPDLTREYGIGRGTLWALLRGKTYCRAGGPLMRRRRTNDALPTLEELASWVEPEPTSGCWIWMRARSSKGYGSLFVRGRVDKAHRVAWLVAHGRPLRGRHVLHRCDNPSCINPAHLFLGSNLDNMRDMVAKGRCSRRPPVVPFPAGEGHPKARLTWSLVREIRARYAAGGHSFATLAAEYGVARETVAAVIARRSWKEPA